MPAPPSQLANNRPWGVIGEGLGPQRGAVTTVFSGIDSNGTSGALDIVGTNGALTLELFNSGTGSIAVNVQHTLSPTSNIDSNTPWEDERMNPLGSGGAITPVVGPVVIPAATVQGFALLDSYPTLRFIVSSANAGALLQARLYLVGN